MAGGFTTARFGPFEFDFEQMVLRRKGVPVHLQPQPTEVLAALLRNPGRLVTRDELRGTVWRDRVIELDAGLNFGIRQIRRALGDSASSPTYIETVHRRGYRFIAPVQVTSPGKARPTRRGTIFGGRRAALGLTAALALLTTGIIRAVTHGTTIRRPAASLAEPTRTTYQAALWLYEREDFGRALLRLDSVRLAAPTFAEAWGFTAGTRLRLGNVTAARAAAERALDLDPDLADAHYWLGRALFMEMLGRRALEAFQRAVELNPGEVAYRQWYAQTLANALRYDEAIRELEEVRRINPIANIVGVDLATVYLAAERYDDAREFCSGSLELVPNAERWARDCLMSVYHFRGGSAAALEQARALMRMNGASDAQAVEIESLAEYFRWDLRRIDRLLSEGEALNPFLRVRATARLGDREETLRGLRSLREERHFGLQWAPRDVWLRFLHGDADFDAILAEADLPIPPPT